MVEEEGEYCLSGKPGAGSGEERAGRQQPHREREPDAFRLGLAHAGQVGDQEGQESCGDEKGEADVPGRFGGPPEQHDTCPL